MQTIKTGVVVALLLAVCYGAFVALNAPEPNLPDELLSEFDWSPDDAGLDGLMDIEMPSGGGLASLDVQSPNSITNGIQTVASQGIQGPADLSLPSLPSFDTSSIAASGSTSPATDVSHSSGNQFASNTAAASSWNGTSVGSLPALPPLGAPSGQGTVSAADGPAVSLNGNVTSASTTATQSKPAFEFQPPAQGQLVSQSRTPSSPDVPSIQLPLLGGPAPTDAGKEHPTLPFATAREQALELASNGKLRDALQILSTYYNSPELNSTQHADLIDILDALSREVVYSPRHLAESPYAATATDTIESLSAKYQITPELFRKINRLGDSKALMDGSQVKVLPGPFRAQVSLGRQELTIFMGELYAGRFPVSFGKDPSPVEGTFEIVDRRRDRTYYGTGGKVIAAGDPRNPYGGYWLNLGQDLCIHGTPEMSSDELQGAGCISLAPLDAIDVYNILAQSSQVSIVR